VDDSGDEIKVFPSLFAAVRYSLTPRLALTLSDAFVRSDSSSTVDQNGIRRGRQTSSTNSFGLTADWLIDRFATQAYYRNVLFFNEDDNQGGNNAGTGSRNDSVSHILGMNASTQLFTDYVVRGGYEFSRTDQTGGGGGFGGDTTTHSVFGSAARQFGLFTSAGVSSTYSYQTLDDTTIWNVSLFGSHGIPQGLSVAGSVGYSRLMNNSGDNDSEHAVSASLSGSYRFATRAVLSVGVSQDFRQTGQQGENFGTVLSRSYFGSFLYQFTPFINSTLFVRYSENEPTGTGNIDDTGTQKTLSYGASINWQVLRWLSAALQYEYLQQKNNNVFNQTVGGTSGDFAENRVTLNLFATF
jgi:hypothetical protein